MFVWEYQSQGSLRHNIYRESVIKTWISTFLLDNLYDYVYDCCFYLINDYFISTDGKCFKLIKNI